jgi:GABA(A) receptor-associated protein
MNLSQLSKSVYEETSIALYNNTPDVIKENINNVVDVFNRQTNISKKKKYTFREKFSLKQRTCESNKILTKYPTKVPIICERLNGQVKDLDRHKYLCPSDLTMGDFIYIIRKRLSLKEHQSLFFLVNDTIMFPNSELLSIVYNAEKDKDGFLYIKYSSENTFG